MKENYAEIKSKANEILDLVIPIFSEEYELKIIKPDLIIVNKEYYNYHGKFSMPLGEFSSRGKFGLIRILDETYKSKLMFSAVISHEIGHTGIYQNCPDYKKMGNNDFFEFLDEGIAKKFDKGGLEILNEEKYFNKFEWGFNKFYQEVEKILFPIQKKIFRKDLYVQGEKIVDDYLKKGVKIRELIKNAKEFIKDIEKNY